MPVTYDPGYYENLHPGEGGGLHAEQLQRVVVGGHVWQQRGSLKAICRVQDEETKEGHTGSRMSHELQERPTHEFPQLK